MSVSLLGSYMLIFFLPFGLTWLEFWIPPFFTKLIPPHVNIDGINAGDSKPHATR